MPNVIQETFDNPLSKTRITHTLHPYNGNLGFDFLGFHIRQYPVGKTHSGKTSGRNPHLLGFKTLIKPSQEALHQHYQTLKTIIEAHPTIPQARLIGQLNPIIKGWTAYYATVTSKQAFSKMTQRLFRKLVSWACRRHPNKPWKWIARKYWHPERGRWNFAPLESLPLYLHDHTPIKRHIKVTGNKSPYDGDWVYWAKRREYQPGIPKRVAFLLKKQSGKCAACKLYFKPDDQLEVDHIIPQSAGGNDRYDNLQLLHPHCHHRKSAQESEKYL